MSSSSQGARTRPLGGPRVRHLFVPLLFGALVGCSGIRESVRAATGTPRTAHARYAESLERAGLGETALGREWLTAADTVLRAAHEVSLPHREVGAYVRDEARATGWRVSLRDGERLVAAIVVRGEPGELFIDAFEQTGDSVPTFAHRATAVRDSAGDTLRLQLEAARDAWHVIRLQPELLRAGRYELLLRVEPTLAFPVPAVGPRGVQSFWGAARDGGARSHEGIDIFAARGTPVIAATDGTVRSTAPNRLGGNVVWLADAARAQVLYYAHLDSVATTAGARVRIGDTLGFVGNTGNAITTRPHLHFGVYRRGSGAVDPWPFVRPAVGEATMVRVDTVPLGARGTVRVATALRTGPSGEERALRRVPARDTVRVVGASGRWYRVQLADGTAGYVAGEITAPIRVAGARAR
ncbi:MAG: M23 family metallopeptidase [Gemmatimonadaceae bacterium]|jgi:murein DD-endopeptidase MepM/ murein hydrolase activator NlpD|nr:M23 family metallopeptidase [Gemmatimonadaceae bacterium]